MYSRSSIINLFYLLFYSLVILLSLAVFLIFYPFKYVDLNSSFINCPDHSKHTLSSGLIFSADGILDKFNDTKARKLCINKVIADYQDYYPDPGRVDYEMVTAYRTESSFLEALLAAVIFFTLGVLLIESLFYYPLKLIGKNRWFNIGQFYLNIIYFVIN